MILNPFVVLEGLDGSGKTSACAALTAELQREGYQVLASAEPTNGVTGQGLRRILHWPIHTERQVQSMTRLFAQDRREHLDVLTHTLNSAHFSRDCTIILFDRYIASSLAYQWCEKDDRESFEYTLSQNLYYPRPDITFYLTAPDDALIQRVAARNPDKQIDFTESQSRLTETRLRYMWAKEALTSAKHRWFEIDTNRPLDEITREMKGILLQWHRSL